MARFYGPVGFVMLEDDGEGIVTEKPYERNYFGEITRTVRRLDQSTEKTNDDIELQNDISITADGYATDNISAIRYVQISGARWKVKSVELRYPKLILNVGGLYHGEPAKRAPEDTGM